MKIVTWNINSVRLRAPLLLNKLVTDLAPDIICLQETKCPNDDFPLKIFVDMGFHHVHVSGMKAYNGVAIASKKPFLNTYTYDRAGRADCRHIAVDLPDFKLHNLYVPAGGDIPDPQINEKFAHKLDFVDDMASFFYRNYEPDRPMVAVGDFNIAPQEHDVWSHKQLLDVVSHTPIEVEKLMAAQASIGWHDAVRHFVPPEQKCYTWWSYRNQDWKKSNRGRRLDHIWVTQPLVPQLESHTIHSAARDWDKCSDHVPVSVTLKSD